MKVSPHGLVFVAVLGMSLLHCGTSATGEIDDSDDDPQKPPQNGTAMNSWLIKGFYKSWFCDASPRERSRVPHKTNRICSNTLLSSFVADGEYPVGAAAVKELYNDSGDEITGYAVYRKIAAGDCSSFYYFEKIGSKIEFNKVGDKTCAGCHDDAGPATMGHDCVFVQIKP